MFALNSKSNEAENFGKEEGVERVEDSFPVDLDGLPSGESKVVAVELIVQSSSSEEGPWVGQGAPFPALFLREAKEYRDLRKAAYPHLETRLIRRYTALLDEVVED